MELSSIHYSLFRCLISIVFSATGIYALRIANIPVSDTVKDQFENFIVLALSYSISYAFLFRPALDLEHGHEELKDHTVNSLTFFACLSACATSSSEKNRLTSVEIILVLVRFCILVSTILVLGKVMKSAGSLGFRYPQTIGNSMIEFVDRLRMFPNHTLSWVLLHGFLPLFFHVNTTPSFGDLHRYFILMCTHFSMFFFLKIVNLVEKQIAISTMAAYAYEQRRIIEIVSGTLATAILAQYYSRVQSVALMFAFLSLATAWLGILANVHLCTDFGIFFFFVTSSLQCAVTLFGLNFYTFLVALGGIILMVLRWKMESLDGIILKLYIFFVALGAFITRLLLVALGAIILKLLLRLKMESESVSVPLRHFQPAV